MRAAIIGCGHISVVHGRAIAGIEGSSLVAAADCRIERAKKLGEEYGATAYADWKEMLEKERPDIVHICTPHHLHTEMILYCLEQGIHVFAEKPPVISLEELARMREVYTGNPRLGVCFQNRWNPEVQAAREVLESGELGRITGTRGFVTWHREQDYYSDDWHGRIALEGGGALITQGIHTLDLLQYLIGEKAVSAKAVQDNFHLPEIEVEDTFCALVQYPSARAVLYATTAYAKDAPTIAEIQCEGGRLRMEKGTLLVWKDNCEPEFRTFSQGQGYGKSYWGSGHQAAIGQFYSDTEAEKPNVLDFPNVEDTVELALRLYESAREGQTGRKV